MDLGLPAGEGGTEINYKNQLTFILGKNDRIFYYQKEPNNLSEKDVKEVSFQGMALSKIIKTYKIAAPTPPMTRKAVPINSAI